MVYSRTAVSTLFVAAAWWILVSLCSGETGSVFQSPERLRSGRIFTSQAADPFLSPHFLSGSAGSRTPTSLNVESTGLDVEIQSVSAADSHGTFGDQVKPLSSTAIETEPVGSRYRTKEQNGSVTADIIDSAEATDETGNGWFEDSDDGERFAVRAFDSERNQPPSSDNGDWQVLPEGLLYRSYLAGYKESRHQWVNLYDTKNKERIWEATLGGRVGLLRSGSVGPVNPEGFQLDLEGAVMARVLPDEASSMLAGSDYRVGLQGTWKQGRTAWKAGYYHISSHVGDEFLLAHPGFDRVNYVRDSLIAGTTYDLTPNTQVYGEIGLAAGHQGGADWLEFQYGAQYAPPASNGLRGAPFAATNVHTRQDFNWISGINTVAGWGWQGSRSKHRLRVGAQHYNGPSQQFSFLNRWENLIGGGIWFDY